MTQSISPQTQKPETQAMSKRYRAAHKRKTRESNPLLDHLCHQHWGPQPLPQGAATTTNPLQVYITTHSPSSQARASSWLSQGLVRGESGFHQLPTWQWKAEYNLPLWVIHKGFPHKRGVWCWAFPQMANSPLKSMEVLWTQLTVVSCWTTLIGQSSTAFEWVWVRLQI